MTTLQKLPYSSYATNNYAEVFHAIVTAYLPAVCVELGVLEGYSTIAIGNALKENARYRDRQGALFAYDLFDRYPYRNAHMKDVWERIKGEGLEPWVSLEQEDAFKVPGRYKANSVDFLHVDLSNTGKTVRDVMALWDPKMVIGGIICFEGGSEDRDQVEWMIKYKAEAIKAEIDSNPIIEQKYIYGTYLPFPSMTMLLKKRI